MTIRTHTMLELAQMAQSVAEGMTAPQIDQWLEDNVGYKLVELEPHLAVNPLHFTAAAAGIMFIQSVPYEDQATPEVLMLERQLHTAIMSGRAVLKPTKLELAR